MRVSVTITPGLDPMDRGYVEDLFAEALVKLGASVDPIGGGTFMGDPPVSDFEVEVEGVESGQVTDQWRQIFGGIPFTLATTVTLSFDGGEASSETFGGPAEC